jgi:phage tail sheath gpL-like
MEMVIVAQRLSTGLVGANVPAAVSSPEQAASYWGAGSILHRMIIAAFRAYKNLVLTGCGLDDAAAGVAATCAVTFTGTATAPGVASVAIGIDTVNIAISTGVTAAQAATALAAEINKYPSLSVTATANLTVVTLTAKNNGTCGNSIGRYITTVGDPAVNKHAVDVAVTAAGLTIARTGFSAGATDPETDGAYAALAGYRYHLYVIPFDNLTAVQSLDAHLESISDEINQKGARGYAFSSKAYADAATLGTSNAKRVSVGHIKGVMRPNYENAAAYAAIQAAQEIPWKAINNRELVGCDVPEIQNQYEWLDVNNLLWAGITPFEVGAGNRVRCVRSISTYTKDDASTPDSAWLDSFKIATADYVRDAINISQRLNFADSTIRDTHVLGEAANIITREDVINNSIAVCKKIEREGGLNNVDAFISDFDATRHPSVPGRIDTKIPIDIVDAAHIFANTINVVSSVQS